MKLLYFSRDYTTHDRRFLASLSQTDHEVSYLRLEARGHTLEEKPLPANVKIISWAGGRGPTTTSDYPALLKSLEQVIASEAPDVIHAGPIQSCAFLAACAGFKPLVSASWGSDLLVDAGMSAWMDRATRFVMSRSTVLVGDCEAVRQKAIVFGMRPDRIVTFPWGIDLDHFKYQRELSRALEDANRRDEPERDKPERDKPERDEPEQDKSRAFSLLSTRSWEPIYGVDVLARGFAKAVKLAGRDPELATTRLQLTMLGNGSQAGLLKSIFEEEGVSERVSYPGQVGFDDLPRYHQQADLYVSASHSDGTSISLLEAMACGRPALVSDIPGNREWIKEGENGWLFGDGDDDALAEGILRAAREKPRLVEMGMKGRQVAELRANWQQNFQCLLQAYDLALEASKAIQAV